MSSFEYRKTFKNSFFIEHLFWLLLYFGQLQFQILAALEDLGTMDDFNFTNFLSDRVMGCTTKGDSYWYFRKAVSSNFFLKVLLINFISNYANLFQHFIFAHFIEGKKTLKRVLKQIAETFHFCSLSGDTRSWKVCSAKGDGHFYCHRAV